MKKTMRYGLLLLAAIAIVFSVAGCETLIGISFMPKKGVLVPSKGAIVVIVGKIDVRGKEISLEDQSSDNVYRFVGLKKDETISLERLEGRVVRIRLKIISMESAKGINAQLIDIAQ